MFCPGRGGCLDGGSVFINIDILELRTFAVGIAALILSNVQVMVFAIVASSRHLHVNGL
jgi:hypothetical protein